ncbi:C40 family peptidase [Erysipelatoclostridium sp. AM42-17]|uniref:C40 family peptidase n=1 Tax=Erysipelatoclostridium sp. AM42-17 TaxID=2293102 RepID=UPI000E47F5D0|nr:immunoglobulin-like domain-containing protein [Erysipelatoclostridium sp. AM42-17]RHS92877.1 peptidoglycan endopeptidase [Erysipelatoclostridium sp. AM42-17]
MDRNIKMRLNKIIQERVIKRKAMFIPIAGVATFMLVGYAAVDKEKPVITSDQIEVPYGEVFDVDAVDVTDNHDSRDQITVKANTDSLDVNQLGTYNVDVTATDQYSNETTKTVKVKVVDQVGPKIETLGSNQGYVVSVPVNGSKDLASYVKATDNVDGDVTPFIEADKELNTSALGTQTITLKATDTSGNETEKTVEFAVADTEAPVINLTNGENVTINYGSTFDLNQYVQVTDNFDTVSPVVEGSVDTKKYDGVQTLTITAKDNSGNESKAQLNVTVKDTEAPQISLSKSSVTVNAGDSLDLASYLASATDNKDGDLKSKVNIPTVKTSKAGSYTATYTVSDAAGNQGSASLTVKVNAVSKGIAFSGNVSSSNRYGSTVVAAAYSRLGCPYVYGASGSNSFDCSGLVMWCYGKAGKSLPHSSGAQKGSGSVIPVSQAQPGDILWRPGHVAIYIGGGKYIHAPTTGDVVKIASGASGFSCAIRPN